MMAAYKLGRFLLDVLYPNKCPFCNEVIAYDLYYCADCIHELEQDFAENPRELMPIANIAETFAVFEYSAETSPFVYSIKDGGNGYAVSAAAKMLCDMLKDKTGEKIQIDLLTCVPTDSSRMRERGYNPPALIASELAAMIGVPFDPRLLIKARRTEIQKSLSEIERRENLRGAFKLNKKRIPSKTVLLIDDVRTTGATLSEAAGVLLSSGAEKVYAGVVAASMRQNSAQNANVL
ncbi:MAG: ComF family protein [Oscillospiraceae bacterium]|nr:ComF family protein [Oscillospiraceae bacterium]